MKAIIILLSLSLCSVMAWGAEDNQLYGEWFTCIISGTHCIQKSAKTTYNQEEKCIEEKTESYCIEIKTNKFIVNYKEETTALILSGYQDPVTINCLPILENLQILNLLKWRNQGWKIQNTLLNGRQCQYTQVKR